MTRDSLRLVFLAASIGVLLTAPARAGVLVSISSGVNMNTLGFFGQSVTTPTGGPFDDITFNFDGATGAPVALGTLYAFSSIYTGAPNALSAAGALGVSTGIAGGEYIFAPTLTLNGGQQYFFYEDTAIPLGTITGNATYAGGSDQYSTTASSDFPSSTGVSANFVLSGAPILATGVPEPITLSIFGAGLVGAAAMRRRKAKRA